MSQGSQKHLIQHAPEDLERSGESGHGGSRRTPKVPSPGGSKGFSRKSFPDSSRKVRPSQFQKWVKKYNGSADPYDHLATFRQVVRAEQITDLHTQVKGFRLTLEGKALSWFQTLEPDTFKDFEALENDFIATFLKMGIKHNVVALIYGFVQKENKVGKRLCKSACDNTFQDVQKARCLAHQGWYQSFWKDWQISRYMLTCMLRSTTR